MNHVNRDGFASRFGVFAAAVGSAVGLGNIWRFPYVAGENGGGAFLLVYFAFVLVIGIPVVLSEFIIGRRGQSNSFRSLKKLAPGKPWYLVGLLGIFAAFIILAFYSTIAGWTLEYVFLSIKSIFHAASSGSPEEVFHNFHTSVNAPVFWQLIFMLLTALVILGGVQRGIEKSSKILMPMLFIILVILSIRSVTLPGSSEGLKFLFYPDFSKINSNVIFSALGQAAFSLSIGMGVLITYGSYIQKDVNLPKTAFFISISDMAIAILAGIAIFPAVFSFGVSPSEGPGLVYIVLPGIFAQMSGGEIFSLLFFILLAIAALTSSISLLEVVVAYFSEEFKMKRWVATTIAASLSAVLGVFTTLSFSTLSDKRIFDKTIFDSFDYFATNILLPLGAFFIVIFLGWFFSKKQIKEEVTNSGQLKFRLFPVFMFIIKFIAPLAIFIVFLKGLNIF
jgi:NSS family neurotransmitter:Na+ symporter